LLEAILLSKRETYFCQLQFIEIAMVEFFTWMKTSPLFPGSVAEIITHAVEGVVRRVQETMRTTGMVKHGMVFNLSPEKLLEIFEDLSSKGMFLSLTKLRIKEDLTAIIGDETRASAVLEGTRPHESPHFCATLKSPSLGFPRAAGWRIIREGELCARRRNDLISFMNS
jgi:hypothetical protein